VLGAEREAEQTGLESDEGDEGESEAEGGCDDDLVGLVEVLPDWECHGCSRASRLERGNEKDGRLDPANFHLSRGWSSSRPTRKIRRRNTARSLFATGSAHHDRLRVRPLLCQIPAHFSPLSDHTNWAACLRYCDAQAVHLRSPLHMLLLHRPRSATTARRRAFHPPQSPPACTSRTAATAVSTEPRYGDPRPQK
jgi:hypothetical protein